MIISFKKVSLCYLRVGQYSRKSFSCGFEGLSISNIVEVFKEYSIIDKSKVLGLDCRVFVFVFSLCDFG